MAMWAYVPDRKLTKRQIETLSERGSRSCFACGGKLLRVAEREAAFPYHWLPNGWICSHCNAMWMGIP
jgi:hypothetical protein